MGCIQDTTSKGFDIDVEMTKDKGSKNVVLAIPAFNEDLGDEEVKIDERQLFSETNEVITFRTKRNDIEPLPRDQILVQALLISQQAVSKLDQRKREQRGQEKLKVDKDVLLTGFNSRIAVQ